MSFNTNYRFDRTERLRSKELKKAEKLKAQADRRLAQRDPSASEATDAVSTEPDEDHDGFERAGEKQGD